MDAKKKKELMAEYKQRPLQGGVCVIRNTKNNRYLLLADKNIQRFKSQFEFMKSTGSCTMNKLMKDWNSDGKDFFTFEMLDEITMKDDETVEEFKENLAVLKMVWQDNFDPSLSY